MNKKIGYTLMMALICVVGGACANVEETGVAVEKDIDESKVEVVAEAERDLEGLVVTIASWATVAEPEVKASAHEEALWEYRHQMMEKYNFEVEEIGVTDWKQSLETFSTETITGDPAAEVYRIHADFLAGALNSGLATDLTTLESIDLTEPKWNQVVQKYMSKDGGVYGFGSASNGTRVLFFNKAILESIGLNENVLYDLQVSGEWTWKKFEEISELVTRDTNNDGANDIFAVPADTIDMYKIAVLSNEGSYVNMDEDGMLYNATMEPNSLEAIEWLSNYYEKDYEHPSTSYFEQQELFAAGKIAMYVGGISEVPKFAREMKDDFGVVCFPKGPKASQYAAGTTSPAWVIPNTYTKEEAEDIAFVLDIWTNEPPGYDGEDDWMVAQYPKYRDKRAVEETLALLKEPGVMRPEYDMLISTGIDVDSWGKKIYNKIQTPIEALEAVEAVWQIEIDKFNEAKSE
ncbi:ABC transporter substrate-binding protein [Candidatus Epulonipiscium viviparus]|uniref:ABC transporter substrate-binding protein n=1 Tax=Candidatus Epulonipiscium viviparus TaxID=420336 RepID=UPI0027380F68|nr:extracellular solute-binding protein [Candidatus Epulopiscium viviparus]